jgi:protein gp37
MLPEWAESLRDQCEAASAAFFFKQWGEWAPGACAGSPPSRTERTATWWDGRWLYDSLTPRQSEELHRDDEPDVYLLGKKAAGALLDGREYKQFPEEENS